MKKIICMAVMLCITMAATAQKGELAMSTNAENVSGKGNVSEKGSGKETAPAGGKAETTFVFDVYGEIPTVRPVFETEHYLGKDITGKWNTFIQNYTHEYDITIGLTNSSVEILKPSIYKAVNKVNKYYKKALKKKKVSREAATLSMAHILDCANVMCFDDNSQSFEEAVKSADEPEEIISLFNQVILRKL
ncbi:hypothetical protein [uncultured Bacteroides sp.]|uniref:hypothetical protein n=1 Tax=uncultured Bacteroides sp. TaxID=162156 RepID=UPI002675D0DA|nr:hypothetical protein [uncultured Bacteroides sp.]